jgi:hypothetical protein
MIRDAKNAIPTTTDSRVTNPVAEHPNSTPFIRPMHLFSLPIDLAIRETGTIRLTPNLRKKASIPPKA